METYFKPYSADRLLLRTENGDLDCTVKHGSFTENRFPAKIPEGMTEKQIRSLYLERDVTGSWIADNVYRLYLISSHCTEIDIFDLTFDTERNLLTLRYQRQGSFIKQDFTVYGIA